VFGDDDETELVLLVDVKLCKGRPYQALNQVLEDYEDILTRVEDGRLIPGKVRVIVSGARDIATIKSQSKRYVFVDARPGEFDEGEILHGTSVELAPWLSTSWRSGWQSDGELTEKGRQKIGELVELKGGRKLRFWKTPDDPRLWRELRAAGVDLIGSDDLVALSRFFRVDYARE
jgi:hypothetical protein